MASRPGLRPGVGPHLALCHVPASHSEAGRSSLPGDVTGYLTAGRLLAENRPTDARRDIARPCTSHCAVDVMEETYGQTGARSDDLLRGPLHARSPVPPMKRCLRILWTLLCGVLCALAAQKPEAIAREPGVRGKSYASTRLLGSVRGELPPRVPWLVCHCWLVQQCVDLRAQLSRWRSPHAR